MVKRILALSLLMVGLAACGSGGGASAEADTINNTGAPMCNCSVGVHRFYKYSPTITSRLSTPLCDMANDWGGACTDQKALCTLIQPDWATRDSDSYSKADAENDGMWEPYVWCKQ